jgi:hypothetical protein
MAHQIRSGHRRVFAERNTVGGSLACLACEVLEFDGRYDPHALDTKQAISRDDHHAKALAFKDPLERVAEL